MLKTKTLLIMVVVMGTLTTTTMTTNVMAGSGSVDDDRTAAPLDNDDDRTAAPLDNDDDDCKLGPGNCGFGSCYARGVEQGKNGDYNDGSQAVRECIGELEDRYYEGFIDGCISAGNTRDVCESATDK